MPAWINALRAGWRTLPIRFRARVKQTADIMRLDYPGAELYVHVDSVIDVDRAASCRKEPGTIEWIERDVEGVFYDIGANIGAYSLVAWAHSQGQTRVVAFEPGASTYPQLCRNLVLNGCGDAVIPLNIALSDRSGLAEFRYGSLMIGAAAHTGLGAEPSPSGRHDERVVFTQRLLARTLDDAIAEFELPPPNHIKIDVDGHELAVLRGADATLASADLRSLQIEIGEHDPDGPAIRSLLESYGLTVHRVAPHPSGPIADYVFTRAEPRPGSGPRSSSSLSSVNGT